MRRASTIVCATGARTALALPAALPAALLAALVGPAGCRTPARTGAPPPPATAAAPVSRAWPAMGTMLVVTAWGADSRATLSAVHAARDSVRLLDSLLSAYRASSELSAVNRAAGGGAPVRVSEHFLRVLDISRRYWRLSGGAFDPTVGPLVAAWGFQGERGRVPPARELDSLRALVGFARVEVDAAARTVRLPSPGMRLDFGGVAKGYALDVARRTLAAHGVTRGMVDLGGNVLVFGPPPAGAAHWRIGVRHPRDSTRLLGVLELDSGAVATSGDYEHYYVIDGVRYGHLVDPRSGRPARGVVSATAVGPSGEWSDGLSASLYLVGPARGTALADSLPGVGALYVTEDGAVVSSRRARARLARSSGSRR